ETLDERPISSRGQARALDPGAHDRTTGPDTFVGTLAYAAPEQREEHWADARSDQYAYCVSLWEALTGARPPRIERQGNGLVPLPPDVRLPARLHRALSRGLSPNPDARFEDMDRLLAALEPARRRWLAPAVLGIVVTALAIAKGHAVLVEQKAELTAKDRQLDRQRRDIDDAASIQTSLQSTLETAERRGFAAMVLALEAARPYHPDLSSAPTPVLQALFDMQNVDVIVESAVIR